MQEQLIQSNFLLYFHYPFNIFDGTFLTKIFNVCPGDIHVNDRFFDFDRFISFLPIFLKRIVSIPELDIVIFITQWSLKFRQGIQICLKIVFSQYQLDTPMLDTDIVYDICRRPKSPTSGVTIIECHQHRVSSTTGYQHRVIKTHLGTFNSMKKIFKRANMLSV